MHLSFLKKAGFIISILIIIVTHSGCKKDACEDCITNQPPAQQPVDSSRWVRLGNLPDEFFFGLILRLTPKIFYWALKGNCSPLAKKATYGVIMPGQIPGHMLVHFQKILGLRL
jgi:hypothetical protein